MSAEAERLGLTTVEFWASIKRMGLLYIRDVGRNAIYGFPGTQLVYRVENPVDMTAAERADFIERLEAIAGRGFE